MAIPLVAALLIVARPFRVNLPSSFTPKTDTCDTAPSPPISVGLLLVRPRDAKSYSDTHSHRPDYQRISRGPSIAPMAVGINIPSRYQTPINGAVSSGQCKEYTSAPKDPAANPAAAPAARSCVGASPRSTQTKATNSGARDPRFPRATATYACAGKIANAPRVPPKTCGKPMRRRRDHGLAGF
jgi:hypothetical protein